MPEPNPYESPQTSATEGMEGQPTKRKRLDYSPKYNKAFLTGILIQAVLAIVTALVLDGGQTHRAFWVAFLCQWAMTWILLFRRPLEPTKLDLAIVRFGIVPIMLMIQYVANGPRMLS